jgi:hypothetical protein
MLDNGTIQDLKGIEMHYLFFFLEYTDVSKLRNSLSDIRTDYQSFSVSPADFLSVLICLMKNRQNITQTLQNQF